MLKTHLSAGGEVGWKGDVGEIFFKEEKLTRLGMGGLEIFQT